MRKVPELEQLAREMVGDGKAPDVFFVSKRGVIQMVTTRYRLAEAHWLWLAEQGEREDAGRSLG